MSDTGRIYNVSCHLHVNFTLLYTRYKSIYISPYEPPPPYDRYCMSIALCDQTRFNYPSLYMVTVYIFISGYSRSRADGNFNIDCKDILVKTVIEKFLANTNSNNSKTNRFLFHGSTQQKGTDFFSIMLHVSNL